MSTDTPNITDELIVAADLLEENGFDRAAKVLRIIPDRDTPLEPPTAKDVADAIRRSRRGAVYFADTLTEDLGELIQAIDRRFLHTLLRGRLQWSDLTGGFLRDALIHFLPQHLQRLLDGAEVEFIDDRWGGSGRMRIMFDNRRCIEMPIDRREFEMRLRDYRY